MNENFNPENLLRHNDYDDYENDYGERILISILNESFNSQGGLQRNENVRLEIESSTFGEIYNQNSFTSCIICLTDFEEQHQVSKTNNCHHLFHTECLEEWNKYKGDCPICRTSL